MSPLKIGIVTATFNRERFVRRVVEQVLRQSYPEFVFVLVHDGPGPNSRIEFERVKAKAGNDAPLLFIETEKRAGDWGATPRLEGMRYLRSNGQVPDYVVFWDDDNSFYPNAIERIVDELESLGRPDLLVVPILKLGERSPKPDVRIELLQMGQIDTANLVTRYDFAYESYRDLNREAERGEDFKFFSKVRARPDVRMKLGQCEPIGVFDGLRPLQSLRMKLRIPSLGVSDKWWYRPIREFFRR